MAEPSEPRLRRRAAGDFTFMSFLRRMLLALFLVLLTFNPSGFSVFHWVRGAIEGGSLGAEHFFVGAILLIGWAILWVATWRSLDLLGVVLAALAVGTLVWMLIQFGLLSAESRTGITWIVLVCVATVFGVGLSWSHIWRRLTGQLEVDED